MYLYSIELAKPILENLNNNFNYSDNHHHHHPLLHHHHRQHQDEFLFLNNHNISDAGNSISSATNINNGNNNFNSNANDSYVVVKEKLHLPHYIRAIINWIGESAIIFANSKENQLMVNEEERENFEVNNEEERRKIQTNNNNIVEKQSDRNNKANNENVDEEEIENNNNILVNVVNDNDNNNNNVMGLFPTITSSQGWQFTVAGRLLIAICFISYILAIINTVAIGLEQRTVLIILSIIFALIFASSLTALLFAILTTTLANGETFQLNPWNSLLVLIVVLSALEVTLKMKNI